MKKNTKIIQSRAIGYILPVVIVLGISGIIIGGIVAGIQGIRKTASFISLALTSKQSLEQKIIDLETKQRQLADQIAQCSVFHPEYKKNNSFPSELIAQAEPLGFALGSGWGTLFINKGTADGILAGDWVVTPERTLIGKIQTLSNHHATVRTIFDTRTKIAASLGPEGVEGLFVVKNGIFLLDLVPLNASSSSGAVVYTSGNDGLLPRGLVLGTITKAIPGQHQSLQTMIVQPAWNPAVSSNILILKNIFEQSHDR